MSRKHKPPKHGLTPMVGGVRPPNKMEKNKQDSAGIEGMMPAIAKEAIGRAMERAVVDSVAWHEYQSSMLDRIYRGSFDGEPFRRRPEPAPEGPPVHLEVTIDVSAFFARHGEAAARLLDSVLGNNVAVGGTYVGNVVETRYSKIIDGKARVIDKNNALEYKPEEAAK